MSEKLSTSKNKTLIYCMTFILFSHAAVVFDAFFELALVTSMLRYLVFIYLFVKFIQKPMINRFEGAWIIFGLYLLMSTLFGHGSLPLVIGPIIDITVLLLLFRIYNYDIQDILKAITFSLSFYIYLNLILLFLFPRGLWNDPISGNGYYLLSGNYNGMGARFICALVTNMLIIDTSKYAKINFICLMVVAMISVILVHSMTSTVCLLMLFVLWALSTKRRHHRLMIAFFIFYLVIQVFVVFTLSDLSHYTYIAGFIQNVLHKDLTFTSRTFLWENSSKMIAESPWIGYGYQTKVWNETHLKGPGAHNFVYTILLYGGYPLLFLMIAIIIASLIKNKSLMDKQSFSRLVLGTNTLFFMMIFDYYSFFIIIYLITLIYYYPLVTQSLDSVPVKEIAPESSQTDE